MKILSIPLSYFITAIVVGIALSFLLASTVFAPSPVDTPEQEITPVPTPKEVYVYVHTTDTPDKVEEDVVAEVEVEDDVPVIPLIFMGTGLVVIFLPFLFWFDDTRSDDW